MKEHEIVTHNKDIAGSSVCLRIKDRHGHFLADIIYDKSRGYILRIYCKRCKEFHEIEISKFLNTGT